MSLNFWMYVVGGGFDTIYLIKWRMLYFIVDFILFTSKFTMSKIVVFQYSVNNIRPCIWKYIFVSIFVTLKSQKIILKINKKGSATKESDIM